ncbi:hypothetical protein G7Z17_g2230 [Cylindrodendrum hubeiense]|uniref:Uncharacterized protein n=1 Tax=Cylindrodendrum hubeiense TaxID=595255 RepID=A0A9P5HK58_9HYPO|nr:hypothetical protein G7Z17_g2230 [Cylindrodendrum hubeiense]
MRQMKHLNIPGTDWKLPWQTVFCELIYISNLTRGHVTALSTTIQGFQNFTVSTSKWHSATRVLNEMCAASGEYIPVVRPRLRDGDVGMCVADPSKAMSQIG